VPRRPAVAAWLQDDWAATSRLTLNLGLRYDFALNVFAQDVELQPFLDGDRPNEKLLFGPRAGATYSLTPQTMVDGKLEPAKEVLTYVDLPHLLSNSVAWKLILLIFIQVIFVTMVYGPIAAYLVEAFPAKIRYTALSLPYHIGNGIFGGLLPLIGLSVVARTGNIYAGLYYPIAVAGLTFIVGSLLLRETRHVRIWHEVNH